MVQPEQKQLERRTWTRLPLAIPVFVRGTDEQGVQFLEFTSALDVSVGGMLVSVGRKLVPQTEVELEVPAVPDRRLQTEAVRHLPARLLRTHGGPGWYVCAFRFLRPLVEGEGN